MPTPKPAAAVPPARHQYTPYSPPSNPSAQQRQSPVPDRQPPAPPTAHVQLFHDARRQLASSSPLTVPPPPPPPAHVPPSPLQEPGRNGGGAVRRTWTQQGSPERRTSEPRRSPGAQSSGSEMRPEPLSGQPGAETTASLLAKPPVSHDYRRSYDTHLSADMSEIFPVSSSDSTGAPGPTVIERSTQASPALPAQPASIAARHAYVPYSQSRLSSGSAQSPTSRASPTIELSGPDTEPSRPKPQYAPFRRKVSKLSDLIGHGLSHHKSCNELPAPTSHVETPLRAASQPLTTEQPPQSPPPLPSASPETQPRLESPLHFEQSNHSYLGDDVSGGSNLGEGDTGLADLIDSTIERVRNMSMSLEELQTTPAPDEPSSPPRRESVDVAPSVHSSARSDSLKSQELEYQPLQYHHAELEARTHGAFRHSSSASDLSYGGTDSVSTKSLSKHNGRPLHPGASLVHLLNSSYPQAAPGAGADAKAPRPAPGALASSLGHKKTFDMYLANVKKTNDPAAQYEFAVFMMNASLSQGDDVEDIVNDYKARKRANRTDETVSKYELIREAKNILQRLADRGYPFAQYHLGDGYSSGFFNKGKPDQPKAFTYFVAASKHGHVESGYRAALCYEFGWGVTKDKAKAVQFYRQAASRGHPGAMLRLGKACLDGDMGQTNKYREGITWLKRAAEAADTQYSAAPFELGLLHETGFGDDVFKDPAYTAQLFTRAADLGHAEAAFRMGDAYEHGRLACPVDPALSIHFYTTAAQEGFAPAMMALSAWYMLGSEGLLERDYYEAFEWAKKAADTGLPKACFAVGYFTEMGIGCRRDPLEANRWYVRAAEQGDQRARTRLEVIRKAAAAMHSKGRQSPQKEEKPKPKRFGIF